MYYILFRSSIRPFRHTITVFGLGFTTSLISLYKELQQQKADNAKLLKDAQQNSNKVYYLSDFDSNSYFTLYFLRPPPE